MIINRSVLSEGRIESVGGEEKENKFNFKVVYLFMEF